MEKKRFKFYQDVKVTIWVRNKFAIEAESKEEALKEVERFKNEDISCSDLAHKIYDIDYVAESQENIPVAENDCRPTIELYDDEDGEMIGDNAPKVSVIMQRTFKEGEHVCYEDTKGVPHKAIVVSDQKSEREDDKIELHVFLNEEDDDSQGIETRKVSVCDIYQLPDSEKKCPHCGEPLYKEHLEYILGYPYYCPWCQENFYDIETQ